MSTSQVLGRSICPVLLSSLLVSSCFWSPKFSWALRDRGLKEDHKL